MIRNIQETINKIKDMIPSGDSLHRALNSFEDGGVDSDPENWMALTELVMSEVSEITKTSTTTDISIMSELTGLSVDDLIV